MNKNITATILIVLAVGLYFTVTENILGQANDVSTKNDQYKSAIDSANKLLAVRDQVENSYKNLSDEDKTRLAKMIPTSVDNIRLIIDLNSVALKHGFSLQNIKATVAEDVAAPTAQVAAPSTPQTSPGMMMAGGGSVPTSIPIPTLSTVEVTFNATASYDQFTGFMKDVEADLRLMDLKHLAMTVSDVGGYNYDVTLKTYWLKDK